MGSCMQCSDTREVCELFVCQRQFPTKYSHWLYTGRCSSFGPLPAGGLIGHALKDTNTQCMYVDTYSPTRTSDDAFLSAK